MNCNQDRPEFVVWAFMWALGGSITRAELARVFAFVKYPPGTLAQTLQALSERSGVRFSINAAGQSVVEATEYTPPNSLDDRAKADALRLLSALEAGLCGAENEL